MSETSLNFQTQANIPILSLDRPQVHNAVDEGLMAALEAALDRIDAIQPPAVILTGSGTQSFCSGGDLRYFDSLDSREQGRAMSLRMQAILERLHSGPRPVIAAINGDAYGGGCEILTACHFRLAVPSARFAFRQAANGVITGWGGGVRLLRLLPRAQALRLLLSSERIDAAEACRLGLIERIVDRECLLEQALAMATAIAENSRLAVASFLELSRCLERDGEQAARVLETERFAESWVGEDFARTLARFRR